MSRAARLGAFIVATLGNSGGRCLHHREQAVSFQLHVPVEGAIRQCGWAWMREAMCGWAESTVELCAASSCLTGLANKVTVVMDLSKSTHEIIKQDSVASIETEGLLGNQYLAISFGSAGAANVRDGDTIASQPPLEMSDLLKKDKRHSG